MSDRDIIDDIDALVDEQMDGYDNRSGYDHNVNQDRCWHCGEDWHGLTITEEMRRMRRWGEVDAGYRYAEDESPVRCPGSEFIGPWATPRQLDRIRNGWDSPWNRRWELPEVLPGFRARHAFDFQIGWRDPETVRLERIRRRREAIRQLAADIAVPTTTYQPMQRLVAGDRIGIESEGRRHEVVVVSDPVPHPDGRIEYTTEDPRYSARARHLASIRDRTRRLGDVMELSVNDALNRMFSMYGSLAPAVFERLSNMAEQASSAMRGYSADVGFVDEPMLSGDLWEAVVAPEPETPQQRALPRPSTTPPMWAVQPNRRNRRRNR